MRIQNFEIFKLHAEFCKTLANPKRLMILKVLSRGEMSVGEIVDSIGTRLATVSQHLRALRLHHIVQTRREGQKVYYRLTDPRLVEACSLIRSVLLDDLKNRGLVAQEMDEASVLVDD